MREVTALTLKEEGERVQVLHDMTFMADCYNEVSERKIVQTAASSERGGNAS